MSDHLTDLSNIQWNQNLFCTPNFFKTIQHAQSFAKLALYLRAVNAMLVFPDGKIVLVSEYEADKLLPHWWGIAKSMDRKRLSGVSHKQYIPHAVFHNLGLAIAGRGFGADDVAMSNGTRTSVKLFRGFVDFSKEEQKALSNMFQLLPPRPLVLKLLEIRGRQQFFERSDLDKFSCGNIFS